MILLVELNGRLRQLELSSNGTAGLYKAKLDGETIEVQAEQLRPGVFSLLIEGRAYRCILDSAPETAVHVEGQRIPYQVYDPRSLKSRRSHAGDAAGPRAIKAPMPGRVVRCLCERGDAVEANQPVIVIEAMKMQNELKTPKAGTVTEIRVVPGDTVNVGQVLVIIE